jgi:hypothetical protein
MPSVGGLHPITEPEQWSERVCETLAGDKPQLAICR